MFPVVPVQMVKYPRFFSQIRFLELSNQLLMLTTIGRLPPVHMQPDFFAFCNFRNCRFSA
jgi:hypothetical protein